YDTFPWICKGLLFTGSGHAVHAAPPVVEDVAQRLLEGNLRPPAHRGEGPGGVAAQHRHVGRAQAGRVFLDADPLDARLREQEIENVLDHPRASGAEVVDL